MLKKIPLLLLTTCLYTICLFADEKTSEASSHEVFNYLVARSTRANGTPYIYNPLVHVDLWRTLEPYFLPIDHPAKAKLDRLFESQRVTLSKDTFEAAGLGKIQERQPTNIVVGKTPKITGIVIKAFLDTQPALPEWDNWLRRILGAQSIRQCIKRHGYTKFKAPRKWIYPLPVLPAPPLHPLYNRKNFILVVEDMRILSYQDNLDAYRHRMTKELLDQLYTILTEEGLIDSVYPDNIPFTKDGYIAFIDTEHHHKAPIKYDRLKSYFSPAMQTYWQKLIDQGGPKP